MTGLGPNLGGLNRKLPPLRTSLGKYAALGLRSGIRIGHSLKMSNMAIKLDHQIVLDVCDHCKREFKVIRGSIYDDDNGIAIYLAAMHACDSGKLVDLAIAIRQGYKGASETSAIALKVRPTATEVQMTIADPGELFWKREDYLGKLMHRKEALASPLIESFFPYRRPYRKGNSGGNQLFGQLALIRRWLWSRDCSYSAPKRNNDWRNHREKAHAIPKKQKNAAEGLAYIPHWRGVRRFGVRGCHHEKWPWRSLVRNR